MGILHCSKFTTLMCYFVCVWGGAVKISVELHNVCETEDGGWAKGWEWLTCSVPLYFRRGIR